MGRIFQSDSRGVGSKGYRTSQKPHRRTSNVDDLKALRNIRVGLTSSLTSVADVSHSENIEKLTLEHERLRRESWSANGERTRQFFFLKDFLDDIRQEVKDILIGVTDLNGRSVRRGLEPNEIEVLTAKIMEMSITQEKLSKENAVLSSLDFPQRAQRHEDIPDAHRETFQWIFRCTETSETKFVDWLERGEDVFWISGRPGSGKSTLMKLIIDSPTTKECLAKWASPKTIVTANHYFWNAGSPIQRSQEGLLRSLIHGLLSQVPDSTVSVLGDRWNDLDAFSLARYRWSLTELEALLRKITRLQDLPLKFALFVDGLDEFEGDGWSTISNLMLNLGPSTDIKLCVSSRPWNIFEDGFGRNPARKLYIHELTQNDIRSYAESRLSEHPRWQKGSSSDMKLMKSLASEITTRAQGVFLWVVLVTRELREGISNYDTTADLRKRFESLPVDLEQFFRHFLSSVEPFYHQKMAGALLITLKAGEPLDIEMYGFHELEYSDTDYALESPMQMSGQDFRTLKSLTSRRLKGWCKGLIETRHERVDFLHRTVRDFLRTDSMIAFLEDKAPRTFHAGLSLLKASVALLKKKKYDDYVDLDIWSQRAGTLERKLKYILKYAKDLDEDSGCHDPCEVLLDNVEHSLRGLFNSGQVGVFTFQLGRRFQDFRAFFRQLILLQNLDIYLSRKLDCDPEYFEDFDQPALSIVLDWQRRTLHSNFPTRNFFQVLQSMLEHGEDINESKEGEYPYITTTPWEEFIRKLLNRDTDEATISVDFAFGLVLESGIFALLLKHGADPNTGIQLFCYICHCHHKTPFWIVWLLLFRLDKLRIDSSQYLQMLRDIFESEIAMKLINFSDLHSSPCEHRSSFWMRFCKEFEDLSVEPPLVSETNESRLRFLAQVLMQFTRAAKAAKEECIDWDSIIPTLRRLLPPKQLCKVLQAMGKSTDQEILRFRKRDKYLLEKLVRR